MTLGMADLHLDSNHFPGADTADTAATDEVSPSIPAPRRPRSERQHSEPDWFDLASNRPGQGMRMLAAAEAAAMRHTGRLKPLMARLLRTPTEERRYRAAAEGQEKIGARLDLLRGWHVLHSIPVDERGAHLDHLVIGPGGVFSLVTRNHPRSAIWVGPHVVRVNGQRTHYLEAVRADADRAQRALSAAAGFTVPVQPALVLLTGSLIPDVTISQTPEDVLVYDHMDLPGVFRRAPRRLTDDQVAVVFDRARRSTTWSDPLPENAS